MKIDKKQVGTDLQYVFGDDINKKDPPCCRGNVMICLNTCEYFIDEACSYESELKEGDTIPLIAEKYNCFTDDCGNECAMNSEEVCADNYKVGECKVEEVYTIFDNLGGYLNLSKGESSIQGKIMALSVAKPRGYTNQKYAIKVKDIIWFDDKTRECIERNNDCMNRTCDYLVKRKDDGCYECNKPTEPIKVDE